MQFTSVHKYDEPVIVRVGQRWMVYDPKLGKFVDTNIHSICNFTKTKLSITAITAKLTEYDIVSLVSNHWNEYNVTIINKNGNLIRCWDSDIDIMYYSSRAGFITDITIEDYLSKGYGAYYVSERIPAPIDQFSGRQVINFEYPGGSGVAIIELSSVITHEYAYNIIMNCRYEDRNGVHTIILM